MSNIDINRLAIFFINVIWWIGKFSLGDLQHTCPSLCLFYKPNDTCFISNVTKQNFGCYSSVLEPQDNDGQTDQGYGQGFKVSNGTKQWLCQFYDAQQASGDNTLKVVLANETWLSDLLQNQNTTEGCSLVLFFVRWCKFCAEIAADYNSLARSYPGMPVIAVDAHLYPSIATKYGVVGVPTVLLFYGGRPVMRLNRSHPTLEHFEKFIQYHAGFLPQTKIVVEDEDYLGPLPTKITESVDVYLYLSTLFVFLSCFVYVLSFPVCFTLIERLKDFLKDRLLNRNG